MPLVISQLGDGARSCVESLTRRVWLMLQPIYREILMQKISSFLRNPNLDRGATGLSDKIIHAIREPKKRGPYFCTG